VEKKSQQAERSREKGQENTRSEMIQWTTAIANQEAVLFLVCSEGSKNGTWGGLDISVNEREQPS
jgi:hypothetical protein